MSPPPVPPMGQPAKRSEVREARPATEPLEADTLLALLMWVNRVPTTGCGAE